MLKKSLFRHSAAMLLIVVISASAFQTSEPQIIKGNVIEKGSLQPVQNAYVHTLTGEEETITKKDGSFTLKTWQAFPVKCTVEHKNFSTKEITINKNDDKITVYLEGK
ncbi:MAG: carboxypeptidase-like regulatory domain-containing protein [Agriterribacter sp.]